jgi:hypothetical protein
MFYGEIEFSHASTEILDQTNEYFNSTMFSDYVFIS